MRSIFRRRKAPHVVASAILPLLIVFGLRTSGARAAAGDLSVTLASGESAVFYNSSASGSFIHMAPSAGAADSRADWAVYNADGSVKAAGTGSRGLQNVPAGGKAVVTNSGTGALTAYGDGEAFSAETGPGLKPALLRFALKPGGSAVFENVGPASASVAAGGADFAVYNADGSLSAFGAGQSSGGLRAVPAGGRLVLTNGAKAEIAAYGAYEAFVCAESAEPALLRTSLAPGATVVYRNATSLDCGLESGKADWAVYDSSGRVGGFGAASGGAASGSKTVPAGGRLVITNPGATNIDVYGAREVFAAEAGTGEALKKRVLEPGGPTVVLTNLSSETASVYSGRADFACYDGGGVLTAYGAASSGYREVAPYGYIVLTPSGVSAGVFAPGEAFGFEAADDFSPALLRESLGVGGTFVYENRCSYPAEVTVSRADYAVYDGSGAYASYGIDASGPVAVPAYGSLVATGTASSASVYGPQAVFTAEKAGDGTPALTKTTLKSGATVNYFNVSSEYAPVFTGRADYSLSLSDGVVYSFGSGGGGEYSVPPEGAIRLTNSGTYPVSVSAPSRLFMAWEGSEPALYMAELAPGGKAVFYSTADYEQSVYVGKCQYYLYKYNGILATSRGSFGGGSVQVPPNGRIEVLNVGTSFITLYGPYDCFAAKNAYMHKYDVEDAGLSLTLPAAALDPVDNADRAAAAVRNALDGFKEEHKTSATALERLALFMEVAASKSAALSLGSGGELAIDAAALSGAADRVSAALASLVGLAEEYKVSLNRTPRTDVRLKCGSDNLKASFTGDFSKLMADRLVIDAPSFDIYIDAKAIDKSGGLSVSYEGGRAALETRLPVTLGLAPLSGDAASQFIADGSGSPVASKYNSATRLIEGRLAKSGSYGVATNLKSFGDLGGKPDEMKNAVSFLASRGVVTGVSASVFSPDTEITRAEIAAMLVRMLDAAGSEGASAASPFTDVGAADWFGSAASAAARLGLIGGYEDGSFRGRNVITKNEILAAAARLLTSEMGWHEAGAEALSGLSRYSDGVADWAGPYAALALRANLYPERVDGSFSGGEGLTRGDAAIIIYRLFMLLW